jgi:hypothetical protein
MPHPVYQLPQASALVGGKLIPEWRRSWKWTGGRPAALSAGRHTRRQKLLCRNNVPCALVNTTQANAVPAACAIGLVEDQCRSGMRTATTRLIKAMTSIMVRARAKGLPSGT